jgi:hypothetical protein
MPGYKVSGPGGTGQIDSLLLGSSASSICYGIQAGTVSIDPPSLTVDTHTTSANCTFTLTGARTGDQVIMSPPDSLEATLSYTGARVTANDTVTVYIYNGLGTVDGASKTWGYLWFNFTG